MHTESRDSFNVTLRRFAVAGLASGIATALFVMPFAAHATCTPSPSGGSDVINCDDSLPDPSPGMDLTAGGNDQLTLQSGTIDGSVTFGSGNDLMSVNGGTVTGSVSQGNGIDTFVMNGGTIASLNQGSGLDVAEMHDGHIVGLFFAGDFFTMTGGRIGEVNLEQANNEMRMSGGLIDGDVRAAQGHDLLELSSGSIGGNVSLGNGNNTIVATGGAIGGDVLTGNGMDHITVDGAIVGGSIDSGAGDDQVAMMSGSVGGGIDTGDGNDGVTLSGGTVVGNVLTGLGDDNVALSGTAVGGDIDTGDGSDTVQIDDGSTGNVLTGAGADSIGMSGGTVAGIDSGDDADTLVLGGGIVTGNVLTGFGDDSVSLSGTAVGGDIDTGDGDDTVQIDGGSAGSVLTGAGTDNIRMAGGTVVGIDTGIDNDAVVIDGGMVTGTLDQGDGNDSLLVNGGEVGGAVTQGNGIDTFVMNGGTIASLSQGSGLDVAEMHGGHIVGLFFAGDFFTMTDGRIGEVDLEQANNEMRMSGGVIDGNVRAVQGHDLLELSSGSIGGNVSLGNGNNTIVATGGGIGGDALTGNGIDSITVDGATVGGNIRSGAGDDQVAVISGSVGGDIDAGDGDDGVTLSGGTIASNVLTGLGDDNVTLSGTVVAGAIDTGDGDDTAAWSGGALGQFFGGIGSDTFSVTAGADLSNPSWLDGGDDASEADGWIDVLTFIGVTANAPTLANWEQIALTDGTELMVGPGGADFGGGNTAIDDSSSIIATPDSGDAVNFEGDIDNDGLIDTSGSGTDIVIGGDLDNDGAVDISDGGGDLAVDGSITNTGTIDASDGGGDILIDGGLDNNGTIDLSGDGGSLDVIGSVVNTGTIDASDGDDDIAVEGDIDNSGTIDLSGDDTLAVDGLLTNTGLIEGGGGDTVIITDGGLINDGIIDLIDDSAGDDLTIVGPIDGTGTIQVDVDITETGGTSDVIDVSGNVDGDVETVINNTGMPLAGPPGDDSGATILTTDGTVDATFTINDPFNYVPIGPWRYEVVNDGSSVRFEAVFDGQGLAALAPSSAAAVIGPESVLAGTRQFLPNIREREGQAVLSGDGRGEMWIRALGGAVDLDSEGYDVGYDADSTGAQLAVGYVGDAGASGQLKAGITAGWLDSRWKPELRSARADLDVDGHAYGLYGTWFQDATQARGWYVDAIAQVSEFDLDIRLPVSPIASYEGKGWGVAAEVGYLHRWRDWRVEPQGRLVYLSSDVDGFTGLDGLEAQANRNDRVLGRLGVRLSREQASDSIVWVPAFKAAVWQRLGGDDDVTVGFLPFQSNMPDTVGELGIGLDARGKGNLTFYAQLDARFGSEFTEYTGELGLRLRW